MTTTTPTTTSPAASAATTAPAAKTTAGASDPARKVAGDFKTFLTLLTAQLKNQDPLKPAESTEFVAQLAQFSTVEQSVAQTEKLDAILEALAGGPSAGLADWIGKEVRAATSAPFDGTKPVELTVTPRKEAALGVLVVRNAAGTEVARISVDPTKSTLTWDGKDATGTTLPAGRYSFAVETYKDGEKLGTAEAEVFAAVVEVRRDGLTTSLVLEDGTIVDAAGVTAIRGTPAGS